MSKPDVVQLTEGLDDLAERRKHIESDRQERLGELRTLFPLTALLAPAILLVFAGFAVYFLNNSTEDQFSFAILSYFLVFSGVFMLLAYHFRVHLTTTEYWFESRYNKAHLEEALKYHERLLNAQKKQKGESRPSNGSDTGKRSIEALVEKLNETQKQIDDLAFRSRWGVYSFACGLVILAGALLVLFTVLDQKNLLTIYSSNPIHGVGVALFVVSYLAFSVIGYRSVRVLQQSSVKSFSAKFDFIDYLFSIVPRKMRVGDSKSVEVWLFRDTELSDNVERDAYLEVELEAAGVNIASKKQLKLPSRFQSIKALWSCHFVNTGKHTVNFTVNKVSPKEDTKEIYIASLFVVQVVSPYRASLNAALTVAISALSALTAFFNILHPI